MSHEVIVNEFRVGDEGGSIRTTIRDTSKRRLEWSVTTGTFSAGETIENTSDPDVKGVVLVVDAASIDYEIAGHLEEFKHGDAIVGKTSGATATVSGTPVPPPVDVTSSTVRQYEILKPGATSTTQKAAVIVTPGTNGQIEYIVEAAFLDTAGTWKYEAHVEVGSDKFTSTTESFKVKSRLSA